MIPKDKTESPRFANCCTNHEHGFYLTKNDIMAIVQFDLGNIYFTSRGHLLRQTIGIAMGSPLSPALAIMNCAYYEDRFHDFLASNHPNLADNFFSLRYMDDLLSFVVDKPPPPRDDPPPCNKHPDGACAPLHPLFHELFHFYHDSLTMEIEPHVGTFKFLESAITLSNNKISAQFFLKNYEKTQNRMVSLFLNTQHWDSYNNHAVKRALITGTLYRIARFTSSPELLLPVIGHWCRELANHGVPMHMVLRCVRRVDYAAIPSRLHGAITRMVKAVFEEPSFQPPPLQY